MPRVTVAGVPGWLGPQPLLGPGDWSLVDGAWVAELSRADAADLAARLRGLGFGGQALSVEVRPPLPRPLVRQARTDDARRRRDTTPGFTRNDVQVDDEGRWSLTPEALAFAMAAPAAGRRVLDATCGVGGNSIGFARRGCAVTAVDVDRARLDLARHNAQRYGVADRIRFVHADAADILDDAEADLVFVDPPWGTDWDRASAAPLPLLDRLWPRCARFTAAWAKVPPSFDPAHLPETTPEAVFGEAAGDARRVKFLLLKRGP
jgi:hypothetical protein